MNPKNALGVGLLTLVWAVSSTPISYSLHNDSLSARTNELIFGQRAEAAQVQSRQQKDNGVEPHRGSGR